MSDKTDNVIRLVQEVVGEGYILNPDDILEANKGNFKEVVLIGYDPQGDVVVCSSHSAKDALWLIELAKHELIESV